MAITPSISLSALELVSPIALVAENSEPDSIDVLFDSNKVGVKLSVVC